MQMLNSENVTSNAITGFKADIHKRWKEKSEEQKRRELVRTIFEFLGLLLFHIIKIGLIHKLCTNTYRRDQKKELFLYRVTSLFNLS